MAYTPPPPIALAAFREAVARFAWRRTITEVHVHHTWEPNHQTWAGERSIIAMRVFHMQENGWSDIAQHLTIAPDGLLWPGRNWNRAPASATGHNGTAFRGPFMFETVGNFDVGHDTLRGPQRASVLGVVAALQRQFGLSPDTMRFHRQLGSPKTCPGTSINYDDLLEELRAYRSAREHP